MWTNTESAKLSSERNHWRETHPLTVDATQWPSGSMNGYAYYHRVDQVNGGDMNHTHTTGFSKKEGFWYGPPLLPCPASELACESGVERVRQTGMVSAVDQSEAPQWKSIHTHMLIHD
jgi:hypothetical protein